MNTPEVWITAYDAPTTQISVAAGVDGILVGDSVGNAVYGFARTASVTMDLLLPHIAAVVRHAGDVPVVADLPAGSYNNPAEALHTATRCAAAGTRHVKLEGAKPHIVQRLVAAGFTVMGHLGLLPQTAKTLKQVAKTDAEQDQLRHDTLALAQAGASRIVLECVPADFAAALQTELAVPLIGIGSGMGTAGQILVFHDVVGLTQSPPPFAQPFGDARNNMLQSVQAYVDTTKQPT